MTQPERMAWSAVSVSRRPLVATIAHLELRSLAQSSAAARDPPCDPLDELVRRDVRRSEVRLRERRVTEQRVWRLGALDARSNTEELTELRGGLANRESFGSGDVHHE